MRIVTGQIPDEIDSWDTSREIIDPESGAAFAMCIKEQGHSDDWMTIKVAAKGKVEQKANYWFVLNRRTGQIGYARDLAIMRSHRPALHAAVEDELHTLRHNKEDPK